LRNTQPVTEREKTYKAIGQGEGNWVLGGGQSGNEMSRGGAPPDIRREGQKEAVEGAPWDGEGDPVET